MFAVMPCTVPVKMGLFLGAFVSIAGSKRSFVALGTDMDSAFAVAMLSEFNVVLLVDVME
jgi:hypothetical protein